MSRTATTELAGGKKRHVLVSGGSRGLGRVLVESLLDAGYQVSTFSRKPTEFTDAMAGREGFLFTAADVADGSAVARFVSEAERKLGSFYGLVNCAGLAVEGVLAAQREDEIDRVLTVNLGGALRLTRAVLRRMLLAGQPGSIVNISSIVGIRGYNGLAAYSASKAGMDGMTRALARELGPRMIRVNSVAPGYLETEMTHGLSDDQRMQIVRRTPIGRLGKPEDVAGPVLFLLSEKALFITGQTLVVDGGITV
jgi:3-oxoacyl-[acyl-carrier protein] reductase